MASYVLLSGKRDLNVLFKLGFISYFDINIPYLNTYFQNLIFLQLNIDVSDDCSCLTSKFLIISLAGVILCLMFSF